MERAQDMTTEMGAGGRTAVLPFALAAPAASALMGASWVLFMLSAWLATWVSYDRAGALERLASLMAGLALCAAAGWLGRRLPREKQTLAVAGGLGILSGLAVVAVTGMVLVLRPANGGPYAATLVTLLPLVAAAASWSRHFEGMRRLVLTILPRLFGAVGLAGLWLSNERSAVAALLLAGVAVGLWMLVRDGSREVKAVAAAVVVLVVAVAAIFFALLLTSNEETVFLLAAWLPETLMRRVYLWRDAWPLLLDYRYSGSGLASTPLVFASYASLTHVPSTQQIHNLYLHTALEQGFFGLAGLVGLMVGALWAAARAHLLRHTLDRGVRLAVLVSLAATLLLGMVDSEAAASRFAGVLFVPVAVALLLHQARRNRSAVRAPILRGAVLAPLAVGALIAFPGTRPTLEANLGTVEQTRTELTNYETAPWAFQDAVRRDRAVDLAPVVALLREVAQEDPHSATALRRLGQITLSQGNYTEAMLYLEAAFDLHPNDRVVRQLLGELYALNGDTESAAGMWSTQRLEQGQLETRLGWHSVVGDPLLVERLSAAIRLARQGEEQ